MGLRTNSNSKHIPTLEEKIISILGEDAENEKRILTKLRESLKGKSQKMLYQYLFFVLAHLRLDRNEAEYFWNEILKHRKQMQLKVGRDVGFRVAMLDYFININKKIKNPLIIEIAIYMETLKTTMVDNLTGVFNTRFMEKAFQIEIKRALRYKQKFSVIFIDLDNFKIYNDTYGHLAGDVALKEIALGIKSNLRAEDILCRYGGEEFIVILPYTDKSQAYIVGERIRERVANMVFGTEGTRLITISAGISSYPVDGVTMSELINSADIALYKAKRNGKNQVIKYNKNLRKLI
jgi:diguanylate cyclase (GGDEF)-like protein